jgi:hypothetical protein
MKLSKTELKVLEQVALGNTKVSSLTKILKTDASQIYRIIKKLNSFIHLENKQIKPYQYTHVQLLMLELSRQSSFIDDFSGCGLKLYQFIKEPKTINEIVKETKIKKSTIFYKFKKARTKSLIKPAENKYVFNKGLWQTLYQFLVQLEIYEKNNDLRIPVGANIDFKNEKEIVFSTKQKLNATLTGFSQYSNYGIHIYQKEYNYYLPNKKLTIKQIFLHSLYKTDNEKTIQNIILVALFYLKHKQKLKISHEIVQNINKVLDNKKVEGYPTLKDIKEKAEMYDIRL